MTKPASFDDYIFLNRWGLIFLGIWKCHKTEGLLHRIHIAVLFTLIVLLLIPQWLDIYVFWGNIDANAETLISNVFTITAFLKLWRFLEVRDVFEDLIRILKNNWNVTMHSSGCKEIANEKHREILVDMADKARTYTKLYGLIMCSTAIMYFISPFVGMHGGTRIRKYPFFGWYYFDRFSNKYYAFCYAFQIITGIVVGIGNYAMDSVFLVAIYHSSAQLRILQYNLKRLGKSNDNNCSSDRIAILVSKHQQEIWNSQKLVEVFEGSSMQQLIVSCTIICVIGFKLIIALNEGSFEVFNYLAFMILAILQIFLYCRPGDELITQSSAVGLAAYQSFWFSLDTVSMKKVIPIILRSQQPLKMAAGKFFVLSLPNFAKILKTSLSFLSLLRAMYVNSDTT